MHPKVRFDSLVYSLGGFMYLIYWLAIYTVNAGWLSPFRRVGCLYLHNIPPPWILPEESPKCQLTTRTISDVVRVLPPHARCRLTQAVTP